MKITYHIYTEHQIRTGHRPYEIHSESSADDLAVLWKMKFNEILTRIVACVFNPTTSKYDDVTQQCPMCHEEFLAVNGHKYAGDTLYCCAEHARSAAFAELP